MFSPMGSSGQSTSGFENKVALLSLGLPSEQHAAIKTNTHVPCTLFDSLQNSESNCSLPDRRILQHRWGKCRISCIPLGWIRGERTCALFDLHCRERRERTWGDGPCTRQAAEKNRTASGGEDHPNLQMSGDYCQATLSSCCIFSLLTNEEQDK